MEKFELFIMVYKLRIFQDPLSSEQNSGELFFYDGLNFMEEFETLCKKNISQNMFV
jgi:hypothetical protein